MYTYIKICVLIQSCDNSSELNGPLKDKNITAMLQGDREETKSCDFQLVTMWCDQNLMSVVLNALCFIYFAPWQRKARKKNINVYSVIPHKIVVDVCQLHEHEAPNLVATSYSFSHIFCMKMISTTPRKEKKFFFSLFLQPHRKKKVLERKKHTHINNIFRHVNDIIWHLLHTWQFKCVLWSFYYFPYQFFYKTSWIQLFFPPSFILHLDHHSHSCTRY